MEGILNNVLKFMRMAGIEAAPAPRPAKGIDFSTVKQIQALLNEERNELDIEISDLSATYTQGRKIEDEMEIHANIVHEIADNIYLLMQLAAHLGYQQHLEKVLFDVSVANTKKYIDRAKLTAETSEELAEAFAFRVVDDNKIVMLNKNMKVQKPKGFEHPRTNFKF